MTSDKERKQIFIKSTLKKMDFDLMRCALE
jgi:hypothetical protein